MSDPEGTCNALDARDAQEDPTRQGEPGKAAILGQEPNALREPEIRTSVLLRGSVPGEYVRTLVGNRGRVTQHNRVRRSHQRNLPGADLAIN